MAKFTHHPDMIHGLLKFSSSTPQVVVVQIASELMDLPASIWNFDRLEVVGCGDTQWGILFRIPYDGEKKTYKAIVRPLTHELARKHKRNIHWSVTNDVTVISRD